MDAFHDFAEMARDYGLIRYFLMTAAVAVLLMLVLFLWGRVGEVVESEIPAMTAPNAAPATSTTEAAPAAAMPSY